MQPAADRFFVGASIVEPARHRIVGPGGETAVQPTVMRVLVRLAEDAGAVVARDVLLADVWPGVVVTDHALTRSISELRRAFKEAAHDASVIETIPKNGYRLVAPVSFDTGGDAIGVVSADGLPGAVTVSPSGRAATQVSAHTQRWRRIVSAVAVVAAVVLAAVASVLPFSRRAAEDAASTRPLTSLQGAETFPAFSPDGRKVAFIWYRDAFGRADLYVKLVDGDALLQLTDDDTVERSPAWSPDGRRLAYMRLEAGACHVYVVDALGGPAERLTECLPAFGSITWSPDGMHIALAEDVSGSGESRLVLFALDTHERRALTDPPPGASDSRPAFSPDGRSVAFQRGAADDEQDLYVAPVAGVPLPARRITHDDADLGGHAWTPDGRALVFSSNRTGVFRMWQVDAGGGTPAPYAPVGAWDPSGPAFAPEGGRMAYVEWFFQINVWRAPGLKATPGTAAACVAASTRSDFAPDVSPDGTRIAFTSDRSGSSEVWIAHADGTDPVRFSNFGNATTSRPRWSPDGRRLAFEMRRAGQSDVYVVDAAGGLAQRLTTSPADDEAPAWSPDGRFVYFGTDRSGRWEVWKVSVGGDPAVRAVPFGRAALAAPGDTTLYVARADTSGLWRYDTATGTVRRLAEGGTFQGHPIWAMAPSGLYFVGADGHRTAVYRYAFGTGETSHVLDVDPTVLGPNTGLAVSPDEAWIYYGRRERAESDLVLVSFTP